MTQAFTLPYPLPQERTTLHPQRQLYDCGGVKPEAL